MTAGEISDIIKKGAAKTQLGAKITLIIGGVFVIIGAVAYLMDAKHGSSGLAIGGLGLMAVIISPLIKRWGQVQIKDAEFVKDTLTNNPKDLVWAYVHHEYHNGVKTYTYVKMAFRSQPNTTDINQTNLPDKNAEAFLLELKKFNPSIALGYTEELEYKFKNKLFE